MNKKTAKIIEVIAERMIVESRTDIHTCRTEEAYCAGCQKMRDALLLLLLTKEKEIRKRLKEIEDEDDDEDDDDDDEAIYYRDCDIEAEARHIVEIEEDARLGYLD
jgi:hypothetical protein